MTTTPKTDSQNTHATGAKNPPAAPTHFYNPHKKSSNSMRMKSTSLTLAAAAVLAALPLANAQNVTATTDPVGFVNFTVNANSDQPIGVPLQKAPIFQGTVTSVTGSQVGFSTAVSLSGTCYLSVGSGNSTGRWEVIASVSNNTITLTSPIPGLEVGNSVTVRPFWTLSSLLPNGGGIPASSDLTLPVAFVLTNNPAATGINIPASNFYVYHSGEQLPAGWYDANTFDSASDVIVSPEVYMTIRNQTGSSIQVPIVGNVPVNNFGVSVVRNATLPQDNLIYNQFPASVTLGSSALVSSGAVRPSSDLTLPEDIVLFFDSSNTGLNPAASRFFAYHSGEQLPAGWYDINTFDSADNVVIPAGAAFTIRKAAGSATEVTWNPSTPYTLN